MLDNQINALPEARYVSKAFNAPTGEITVSEGVDLIVNGYLETTPFLNLDASAEIRLGVYSSSFPLRTVFGVAFHRDRVIYTYYTTTTTSVSTQQLSVPIVYPIDGLSPFTTGRVRFYEQRSKTTVLPTISDISEGLLMSEDGRTIITSGYEKNVADLPVQYGKFVSTIFTPEYVFVVIAQDSKLTIINSTLGEVHRVIRLASRVTSASANDIEGRFCFSCYEDTSLFVLQFDNIVKDFTMDLIITDKYVHGVSTVGDLVAFGNTDEVQLVNLKTGEKFKVGIQLGLWSIKIIDNAVLVCSAIYETVTKYDLSLNIVSLVKVDGQPSAAVLNNDGQLLVSYLNKRGIHNEDTQEIILNHETYWDIQNLNGFIIATGFKYYGSTKRNPFKDQPIERILETRFLTSPDRIIEEFTIQQPDVLVPISVPDIYSAKLWVNGTPVEGIIFVATGDVVTLEYVNSLRGQLETLPIIMGNTRNVARSFLFDYTKIELEGNALGVIRLGSIPPDPIIPEDPEEPLIEVPHVIDETFIVPFNARFDSGGSIDIASTLPLDKSSVETGEQFQVSTTLTSHERVNYDIFLGTQKFSSFVELKAYEFNLRDSLVSFDNGETYITPAAQHIAPQYNFSENALIALTVLVKAPFQSRIYLPKVDVIEYKVDGIEAEGEYRTSRELHEVVMYIDADKLLMNNFSVYMLVNNSVIITPFTINSPQSYPVSFDYIRSTWGTTHVTSKVAIPGRIGDSVTVSYPSNLVLIIDDVKQIVEADSNGNCEIEVPTYAIACFETTIFENAYYSIYIDGIEAYLKVIIDFSITHGPEVNSLEQVRTIYQSSSSPRLSSGESGLVVTVDSDKQSRILGNRVASIFTRTEELDVSPTAQWNRELLAFGSDFNIIDTQFLIQGFGVDYIDIQNTTTGTYVSSISDIDVASELTVRFGPTNLTHVAWSTLQVDESLAAGVNTKNAFTPSVHMVAANSQLLSTSDYYNSILLWRQFQDTLITVSGLGGIQFGKEIRIYDEFESFTTGLSNDVLGVGVLDQTMSDVSANFHNTDVDDTSQPYSVYNGGAEVSDDILVHQTSYEFEQTKFSTSVVNQDASAINVSLTEQFYFIPEPLDNIHSTELTGLVTFVHNNNSLLSNIKPEHILEYSKTSTIFAELRYETGNPLDSIEYSFNENGFESLRLELTDSVFEIDYLNTLPQTCYVGGFGLEKTGRLSPVMTYTDIERGRTPNSGHISGG